MLLRRVFVSSYVWVLFLSQAHRALLCTFLPTNYENVTWDNMYTYHCGSTQSYGGCLKECSEEIPECAIVGVQAQGSNYKCCIFGLSSTPNNLPWYDDLSMEIYKLERDVVDVKCPLAVDVFP